MGSCDKWKAWRERHLVSGGRRGSGRSRSNDFSRECSENLRLRGADSCGATYAPLDLGLWRRTREWLCPNEGTKSAQASSIYVAVKEGTDDPTNHLSLDQGVIRAENLPKTRGEFESARYEGQFQALQNRFRRPKSSIIKDERSKTPNEIQAKYLHQSLSP